MSSFNAVKAAARTPLPAIDGAIAASLASMISSSTLSLPSSSVLAAVVDSRMWLLVKARLSLNFARAVPSAASGVTDSW